MFDLNLYLIDKRKQIDAALQEIITDALPEARLIAAMRYALLSEGKRLRPVLCLAACETVGGDPSHALPAACALEMVHTYSLIHDDLPAMDNDDLRRGRPTCHIAFDEATAILAGDALLTLAFETLSSHSIRKVISADRCLDVISLVSTAAGYQGMVEGQMRDMLAEQTPLPSYKKLQELHLLKTSALIEAAVCSGAILGKGSSEQMDCLQLYSGNIGLAFQITDDILNVEGDPKVMGKGAGTDRYRYKSTCPSLLGLEASKTEAVRLIDEAVQALAVFDHKADPLRAIAAYILNRNK